MNSTPIPRNRSAAAAILLVAAALRLPLLDHRPMHADEAILADKFGTLLATGAYPYDPHEYHGPMLACLAWIPAHLAGRTTYAALTETVLRLAPAAAGILLALDALLLAPVIGSTAANTGRRAGGGIAGHGLLQPLLHSGDAAGARHRPVPGLRSRGAAARGRSRQPLPRLHDRHQRDRGAGLGRRRRGLPRRFPPAPADWRAVALFLATLAAGVSILLAPPWKWAVLAEAAASYLQRAAGGPHVHPWYAYLQWLVGWGYRFSEAPILLLAAAGMVVPGAVPSPSTAS